MTDIGATRASLARFSGTGPRPLREVTDIGTATTTMLNSYFTTEFQRIETHTMGRVSNKARLRLIEATTTFLPQYGTTSGDAHGYNERAGQ